MCERMMPWTVRRPVLLAGVNMLARVNAAHGVTFSAVLPGRLATDRLVSGYGSLEAAEAAAGADVPAGRLGSAEEVAAAAAFFCSQAAAYVTGQWVLVDGGLTRSW